MNFARYFELSRSSEGQNVRPMEGLRGFAVFLVFLVHYVTLISPGVKTESGLGHFLGQVHSVGNAGVDLFFVLSGYLIYGSLIGRPQGFLQFMWRRIVRIYPAFCVVFVIYLLLSLLHPAESKLPGEATKAAIYLVQNLLLLPGLFPIQPLITVAWSLSYEMFYYLVIPVVIRMFALAGRSNQWRIRFFMGAAAALALYCIVFGGPIRLAMFIAGVLVYEAIQARSISPPASGLALLALAAGLAATLLPLSGQSALVVKMAALFGAFFIVCFACFSDPRAWLARAFSWTPMRWLGNMSYSYYLLHGLALKVGFMFIFARLAHVEHQTLFALGMLAPMFLLSLLPAIGLFLFVERPLSLLKSRAETPLDQTGGVATMAEMRQPVTDGEGDVAPGPPLDKNLARILGNK